MFTEVRLEKKYKGMSSCPSCDKQAGNIELKYFECKTCGAGYRKHEPLSGRTGIVQIRYIN